jgi:hypothetical protein
MYQRFTYLLRARGCTYVQHHIDFENRQSVPAIGVSLSCVVDELVETEDPKFLGQPSTRFVGSGLDLQSDNSSTRRWRIRALVHGSRPTRCRVFRHVAPRVGSGNIFSENQNGTTFTKVFPQHYTYTCTYIPCQTTPRVTTQHLLSLLKTPTT